jgi:glutaredoxin
MMTKDFLRKNNIPFENIDVGADPQAGSEMMEKSGQMGVPVLDIDGTIIVGFDKDAISRALGIT